MFAALLALWVLGTPPPPGAAGDDATPSDEVVVFGGGRPAEDPRAPTAFVTVVRPDERPGAAPDVADLLEGIPGAHVRRTGETGRAAWLQVRGASAHQVAVFLDDLPLGGGRGSAVDLASVPAALVDQVELLRGAAGAAYGGGAQGGVLRLVTRPPRLGSLAEARLRAGTVHSLRLDGALGIGAEDRGLVAVAQGTAAAGDFPYVDVNGNPRVRQNNQALRGGGLVQGFWELPGRRGRVFGLVEGVALERGEPGVEQFERLESASARQRLQASAGWRSAPGAAVEARAVVFGQVEGYRFVDPQPVFSGPALFDLQDRTVGGLGRLAGRLGDHGLSLLGELRHEGARTAAEGVADRAEQRLRAGLTAADAWSLTPDLVLSGALRLDLNQERAAALVPHGGLRWQLASGFALRANLGRLFRDPGFDERFFVGQGIRGDPRLRFEDGFGGDAGVSWLHRRWSAELVGFAQRFERLILFAPLGAYQIQAQDRFQAAVEGVEARLAGQIGIWEGALAWTGLRARFAEAPRAALPHRPAQRLDGHLAARLGPARGYGRFAWRGPVFVDVFESRSLPAYGTVDLGVEGALGAGLGLGLELRNLLDTQGLDAAQQPLPGRRWFLSLSWVAGP